MNGIDAEKVKDMKLLQALTEERDRIQKLTRKLPGLNAAIKALHVYNNGAPRKGRRLSAKSRAKIAAAQRARWARERQSRQNSRS
jgi:hypothetical protein